MKKYFLERRGTRGDVAFFWKQNDHGYTPNIDQAKQFTEMEVAEIFSRPGAVEKYRKWPVPLLQKGSVRMVEGEFLDLQQEAISDE